MNVKIDFQCQTLGKKRRFLQEGTICYDAWAHKTDFLANDTSIFQVIHFDIKLPFCTNFCPHQFSQKSAIMICNSRPKHKHESQIKIFFKALLAKDAGVTFPSFW